MLVLLTVCSRRRQNTASSLKSRLLRPIDVRLTRRQLRLLHVTNHALPPLAFRPACWSLSACCRMCCTLGSQCGTAPLSLHECQRSPALQLYADQVVSRPQTPSLLSRIVYQLWCGLRLVFPWLAGVISQHTLKDAHGTNDEEQGRCLY